MYGCSPDTVYLSTAPLYHAAPLRFTMMMMRLGATSIVMEHFDPALALALIERHRVTLSQWVPTMFVRMLKLPEAERRAYDVSSQKVALHAAAPCPIEVKEQMIEWWGPILIEYYGATEGHGSTQIDSKEWLAHKGSVGRALNCTLHILDDDGTRAAAGRGRHGVLRGRQPLRVPQRSRRRRPARATRRAGPPSATWATSTPRATST